MNAVDTREAAAVATTPRPTRSLAKLWAAGTGIAIVTVASASFLARAVAGPLVVTGAGEITLGNVIGFTMLGATIGAVFAYVLGRFARRPRLTFLAATLIALGGYAVVPFTAAESTQTATWLNVLHLVVAIPVIWMFTRYLPTGRTSIKA